jgi:hypothetical protein
MRESLVFNELTDFWLIQRLLAFSRHLHGIESPDAFAGFLVGLNLKLRNLDACLLHLRRL